MKRRQFLKFTALSATATLISRISWAQEEGSAKERWNNLSEDQKIELREKYAKYKALPASEKQALRDSFQKFKALSPEQKSRIRQNFRKWKELKPEQKEGLR